MKKEKEKTTFTEEVEDTSMSSEKNLTTASSENLTIMSEEDYNKIMDKYIDGVENLDLDEARIVINHLEIKLQQQDQTIKGAFEYKRFCEDKMKTQKATFLNCLNGLQDKLRVDYKTDLLHLKSMEGAVLHD